MVTARADTHDVVAGLEAGADESAEEERHKVAVELQVRS